MTQICFFSLGDITGYCQDNAWKGANQFLHLHRDRSEADLSQKPKAKLRHDRVSISSPYFGATVPESLTVLYIIFFPY